MSLESEFNEFKNEVLKYAEEKAREIIKNALKEKDRKVTSVREEAEKLYRKRLKELEVLIERNRNERINRIEFEYRNKKLEIVEGMRRKVITGLKKHIEENFKELAECFLRDISERFDDGDVYIPEELKSLSETFEKFNVKVHGKKEIVFEKENVIVRFSAETVLQEYEDTINRELLKVFEE